MAAIGSPFLIPKSLMAFFAFLVTGVRFVSWFRTFFAFSRGSPDLPVAMLMVTFSILMVRSGLLGVSSPGVWAILLFLQFNQGYFCAHRYHVFRRRFERFVRCLDLHHLRSRVCSRRHGDYLPVESLVSTVNYQTNCPLLKGHVLDQLLVRNRKLHCTADSSLS